MLQTINPHAAAIDVGRERLYVAVVNQAVQVLHGAQVANIATARKLAVLFYNTLRYGLAYVEQGLERYQEAYRQQCLRRLQRNARQFGLTLVPARYANV